MAAALNGVINDQGSLAAHSKGPYREVVPKPAAPIQVLAAGGVPRSGDCRGHDTRCGSAALPAGQAAVRATATEGCSLTCAEVQGEQKASHVRTDNRQRPRRAPTLGRGRDGRVLLRGREPSNARNGRNARLISGAQEVGSRASGPKRRFLRADKLQGAGCTTRQRGACLARIAALRPSRNGGRVQFAASGHGVQRGGPQDRTVRGSSGMFSATHGPRWRTARLGLARLVAANVTVVSRFWLVSCAGRIVGCLQCCGPGCR